MSLTETNYDYENLLSLERANVVAASEMGMVDDEVFAIQWQVSRGSGEGAISWLKENALVRTDFTVKEKQFSGTFRTVQLDWKDSGQYAVVTQSVSEGYYSTLDWTAARLITRDGVPQIDSPTDNPIESWMVEFPYISPTLVESLARATATSYSNPTIDGVILGGGTSGSPVTIYATGVQYRIEQSGPRIGTGTIVIHLTKTGYETGWVDSSHSDGMDEQIRSYTNVPIVTALPSDTVGTIYAQGGISVNPETGRKSFSQNKSTRTPKPISAWVSVRAPSYTETTEVIDQTSDPGDFPESSYGSLSKRKDQYGLWVGEKSVRTYDTGFDDPPSVNTNEVTYPWRDVRYVPEMGQYWIIEYTRHMCHFKSATALATYMTPTGGAASFVNPRTWMTGASGGYYVGQYDVITGTGYKTNTTTPLS